MIEAFINSIGVVLIGLVSLYKWIIIISALISWINPDPNNQIVQVLYKLSNPSYKIVKKYIPTTINGMDLAPLVIIFALIFLETFLTQIF